MGTAPKDQTASAPAPRPRWLVPAIESLRKTRQPDQTKIASAADKRGEAEHLRSVASPALLLFCVGPSAVPRCRCRDAEDRVPLDDSSAGPSFSAALVAARYAISGH